MFIYDLEAKLVVSLDKWLMCSASMRDKSKNDFNDLLCLTPVGQVLLLNYRDFDVSNLITEFNRFRISKVDDDCWYILDESSGNIEMIDTYSLLDLFESVSSSHTSYQLKLEA